VEERGKGEVHREEDQAEEERSIARSGEAKERCIATKSKANRCKLRSIARRD